MMSFRPTYLTYGRYQLRSELRTSIFWAIGLCLYSALLVSIYPSLRGAVTWNAIPGNLREAFNIADYAKLAGFLSSQLFGVILPLVFPFYAMVYLSNVVAGAEERGRLDVLLGNPIPRRHLILASFAVMAIYGLLIALTIGVVIWTVATMQDVSLGIGPALAAGFALWPVALAFGAFSLLCSAMMRSRAAALGIPAAVVLLSYLLLVIGRLSDPLSLVRYVSAYHYYGVAILDGVWWTGALALVSAALILVALAVTAFDRRDIYA